MKNKAVVLFDIDYTLFDTDHFKGSLFTEHRIYKEVRDVLGKISKVGTVGIFSEGDIMFQKTKLKNTDIEKYFGKNNTHIVLDKLSNLGIVLRKYRNRKIFFIDDKLNVLHEAKKLLPLVFTIWIKRGLYARNQKEISGFKPDAAITNLKEVVNLILNT